MHGPAHHLDAVPAGAHPEWGLGKSVRFADVTRGATVIEYEPPKCFGGEQGERFAGRIQQLESEQLILDAGTTNMLTGNFFSWCVDDAHWVTFSSTLHHPVNTVGGIGFDVTLKDAASTRDLFNGLSMNLAPQALWHAHGEYSTLDWLVSHSRVAIDGKPTQSLLDPTCGSGTFVLEGLRRRAGEASHGPLCDCGRLGPRLRQRCGAARQSNPLGIAGSAANRTRASTVRVLSGPIPP